MRLEMRAWDMDIRLNIEDSEDTYNQLEVIQSIKDLIDNLSAFEKVNLSVVSVPQENKESEEDLNNEEDDSIAL